MSGVETGVKVHILSTLLYKEGVLPMRYLGVPLISTKPRATDCDSLVHRIVARVKSWTSRALSYAGRIQLIKSVLWPASSFFLRR